MLPRKLYYLSPDRVSLVSEPSYVGPSGRLVEAGSPVTVAKVPSQRSISAYTVDPSSDTVFWVDNTGRVERLSPSGDRTVLAEAGPGINNLAVVDGRLYWRAGNVLASVPVEGGSEVESQPMRMVDGGAQPVLLWPTETNQLMGVDKDGNKWMLTEVPVQRVWRQGPNLVFFTTPENTVSPFTNLLVDANSNFQTKVFAILLSSLNKGSGDYFNNTYQVMRIDLTQRRLPVALVQARQPIQGFQTTSQLRPERKAPGLVYMVQPGRVATVPLKDPTRTPGKIHYIIELIILQIQYSSVEVSKLNVHH